MALVSHARAEMAESLKGLDPAYLQRLILEASQWTETICGRFFEKKERTQVINGDREKAIFLKATPVESIASVVVKDRYGDTESFVEADFRFDADIGELNWAPESEGTKYFRSGFQNVTVVYTGGYDPVPFDLQAAVVALAAKIKDLDNGAADIRFEKMGEYSVSYGKTKGESLVPSHVMSLLAPYMRRST